MTREEHLQEIAKQIYDVNSRERDVKKEREELRDEFFRLVRYDFTDSPLLPVRTIEVPVEFWETTGITKDDFVASRFPGWNVEHIERDIARGVDVFVFKKDPSYMSSSVDVDVEGGKIRVSKEINEYSPEVDWDTLYDERPDVFDKISKRVVKYEVDDAKLAKLVDEDPETFSILQRHLKVKKPIQKLTARKVKDDD